MILMGDEVRRTQRGNNNAYCQDNDISWFDWSLTERHPDVLRFVRLLIERRLLRDPNGEQDRVSLNQWIRAAAHAWHGVQLNRPDWSEQSHSLAFSTELANQDLAVHMIFNAYHAPLHFELPHRGIEQAGPWRRWIDTYLESPEDIVPWDQPRPISGANYCAGPHSVAVLVRDLGSKR
jgi:glycogen operon protein